MACKLCWGKGMIQTETPTRKWTPKTGPVTVLERRMEFCSCRDGRRARAEMKEDAAAVRDLAEKAKGAIVKGPTDG